MMYKAPFKAMSKAIYSALKADGQLEWFDSSVPIFEIEEYFVNKSEFEYGIFGASTADCESNKDDDVLIWQGSLDIEIYSNYKGRKRIAEQLEHLLNYLSDAGYTAMAESLEADGFNLSILTVGALTVNMPIFGETGIWQSGATTITFTLEQQGDA